MAPPRGLFQVPSGSSSKSPDFRLSALPSAEIKVPVAVTLFPDEILRAQERWARRAFPTLSYFNEVDRGGHFAMWEYPELFATELRAAFKSLR